MDIAYVIAEVAVPASDEIEPSWVARQEWELDRAVALERTGHADFVDPLRARLTHFSRQRDSKAIWLVALSDVDADSLPPGEHGYPVVSLDAAQAGPEGRVLASLDVSLPLTDNEHLAYPDAVVAPAVRRHGIGSALAAAAERLARRYGRDTLQAWTTARVPAPGAAALIPGSGVSAIAPDAVSAFLQHRGWVLEQVERQSELRLPTDADVLDPLWDDAVARSAGYRIESWDGRTPEALIPGLCRLLTHFSTAAPLAGLDAREENWTPERYRARDERRLRAGRRPLGTVARHAASGDIVALTELSLPSEPAHAAFQNVTIVDSVHRGHRLGMLTKIANVRALEAADPSRRIIYTWNAHENRHMLAINDAMGFVASLAEAAWQKRLPEQENHEIHSVG